MVAIEGFEKIRQIGEGTYATVYQARNLKTGAIVALKEIVLKLEEGMPSTALREIALLKELAHPNILKLIEVIQSDDRLVMVFEFLDSDLKKFLDFRKATHRPLLITEIKDIMRQLLRGVQYCHEKNIMHRDLKPQNLLIDRDGCLKLADFGLSRVIGIPVAGFSTEVVTLWYRAPDVLLGSSTYSTKIDMWSIGCIMAELYLLSPIFPGKNVQDQICLIFKFLGTPNGSDWLQTYQSQEFFRNIPVYSKPNDVGSIFPMVCPSGRDLLTRFFEYNPERRISAKEALCHPYFQEPSSL